MFDAPQRRRYESLESRSGLGMQRVQIVDDAHSILTHRHPMTTPPGSPTFPSAYSSRRYLAL
jgi:hypothetical protein